MSAVLPLIALLLRETLGRRTLGRGPLPASCLAEQTQIEALDGAGGTEGRAAAGYLFHTARISAVIQGCQRVLDLGCGTGVQLIQVARLHPEVSFVGVDRSSAMLARAAERVAEHGVANVELQVGDITDLQAFPTGNVDAVMGTMTLHHLPDQGQLHTCLKEARRVLAPGGALYLEDFARLKSLRSVKHFASMHVTGPPDAFAQLYACSLQAAFLPEELDAAISTAFGPEVSIYQTFLVPFLVVAKTADRPLPAALRQQLAWMRAGLPVAYRRDLDDLRRFFALGGLPQDPFA